jgi:hypothetical protein
MGLPNLARTSRARGIRRGLRRIKAKAENIISAPNLNSLINIF